LPDNLTARIREELAKRGTVATEAQIFNILQQRKESQTLQPPKLGGPFVDVPQVDAQESKGGVLNAVGAGLWTALDVAAFGAPGAFIKEEEFLDLQDPLAKYTSAFGGLAGFIAGAPMKLGVKAVSLAARPFIKGAGKEAVDSVISNLTRDGIKAGVSSSTRRKSIKTYRNLVRKAQTDKDLAENFSRKAIGHMDNYIGNAVATGKMTSTEARAVKEMFSGNLKTRPLQDFIGLMAEQGLAQTYPRLMRVIGHGLNDALMFGLIDTVFEGFSTFEDHEFDWTAPLWGAATGIAFSQISWLKPRGKSAKFLPDFRAGVRATFAKDPYKHFTKRQLGETARFYGRVLPGYLDEATGKRGSYIAYPKDPRGKTGPTVDLQGKDVIGQFDRKFGKDKSKAVLRDYLDSERLKFGKRIMKWSTTQSLGNMQANWMRMAFGGILFNFHTLANMFLDDYEPDIHDVLPHFLIGAFMQLGKNTSRFDLASNDINQVRKNLYGLGFDVRQLHGIPSFNRIHNPLENGINNKATPRTMKEAEGIGVYSDINEVITPPLPKGEISLIAQSNTKFNLIYDHLISKGRFHKNLDQISVAEGKRIVDAFEKDTKLKTVDEYLKFFEEQAVVNARGFEREFSVVLEKIQQADNLGERPELDITYDSVAKTYRVPNTIEPSRALEDLARDGKLDFIKGTDGRTTLSGDAAVEALWKKFDGYVSLVIGAQAAEKATEMPTAETHRTIESSELARRIYDAIETSEAGVNRAFPNKTSYADPFTYSGSFDDYMPVIGKNSVIKVSEQVKDIFSRGFEDGDKLASYLRGSGLLQGEGIAKPRLITDIDSIKITFEETFIDKDLREERSGKIKRALGRILELQSSTALYPDRIEFGKNELSIEAGKAEALINFLKGHGLKQTMSESFHQDIISFLHKDAIKGSGLTMDDANSLFKLSELGFARSTFDFNRKAQGFEISPIDEKVIPIGFESGVIEYNNFVNGIVGRSNGIVSRVTPKKVLDGADVTELLVRVQSGETSGSATKALIDFIDKLPTTANPEFKRDLTQYITYGGESKVLTWLAQSGVMAYEPKSKSGFKINMEKFTKEVQADMTERVKGQGFTPDFLKREIELEERMARDILNDDVFLPYPDPKFTFNHFLEKYQVDRFDLSLESSEVKKTTFESLLLSDTSVKRRSASDIVGNALKRISVRIEGDQWVRFDELPSKNQPYYRKEVTKDIVKLIGSQFNQRHVNTFKYENGNIVHGEMFQQSNNWNRLTDKIGLSPVTIDTQGIVYDMYGNRVSKRFLNLFGATANLPKRARDEINTHRNYLKSELDNLNEAFSEDLIDANRPGLQGMVIFELSKGMEPQAFSRVSLPLIANPYGDLVKRHSNNKRIEEKARARMDEVYERIQDPARATDADYEFALRQIMFEDMLTGKTKHFLEDFFNDKLDVSKVSGRIKLYNSKEFVRFERNTVLSMQEVYAKYFKDRKTAMVIGRMFQKNNFGVAIVNDGQYSTVKREVERFLEKNPEVKREWDWTSVMGSAHEKASAYDSIAFVSKDMMRFMHAMIGNDPNSRNPIKPVISSGGRDGKTTLLLGKTLFVYSDSLDKLFSNKANKGLDVVLALSGAKAFNRGKIVDGEDSSLVNMEFEKLSEGPSLGVEQIRKIPLNSIGLKPEADKSIKAAAEGLSDYNWMKNQESSELWREVYENDVKAGIEIMGKLADNPVRLRQFMMKTLGDSGLSASVESGGTKNLTSMMNYLSISNKANPLSIGENNVKNKLYNSYMNAILNGRKSNIDNQDRVRYGGQSYLIQVPDAAHRLKPTLVNSDGTWVQRGEIMIGAHEKDVRIADMINNGRDMILVDGAKVLKPEDVFSKKSWDTLVFEQGLTLERLFEDIEFAKEKGKLGKNVQIGIMVSRKPRTRPNDFAILGLKGFLGKGYGRATMVNSLDVVNVFEGDYDADAVHYFYGSNRAMQRHVVRASQFFVQAIDPADLQRPIDFSWTDSVTKINANFKEMAASADLAKKSIGTVQTLSRMLGFLDSISFRNFKDPGVMKEHVRTNADGSKSMPGTLLFTNDPRTGKPDKGRIVIDFDTLDYLQRKALESQHLIDLDGGVNTQLMRDITTWKSEFLFPEFDNSIRPGEINVNHVNNMINRKQVSKRIRIFRHLGEDGKEDRPLTKLEQDMISIMMSEYGRFLNVAGEKTWQSTGEQRQVRYDDVYEGSHRFFEFNKDLSKSLFYKLAWRKDAQGNMHALSNEFKSYFVRPGEDNFRTYKDKKGKDKKFYFPTKNIFDGPGEGIKQNSTNISKGERGNIAERAMQRFYEADIFENNQSKKHRAHSGVTGGIVRTMDDWYNALRSGNASDYAGSVDYMQQSIIKAISNFNSGAWILSKLRSNQESVKNNYRIPYKARQAIVKKIDKSIKAIEKKISSLAPKKYWETRRVKDLTKFSYVPVEGRETKEAVVRYSTINTLKDVLGGSFSLSSAAKTDLQAIKDIRKMFYSNSDNLGDILRYNATTLLTKPELDFLSTYPTLSQFYEVETRMLSRGVQKHGLKFILSFMESPRDRYKIGVFRNRLVSMPYQKSKRYSRGLQFLSEYESNLQKFNLPDVDRNILRQAMKIIQTVEFEFDSFFNERTRMRNFDEREHSIDIGDGVQLSLRHVKLPNFDRELTRVMGDYDTINWQRGSNRISSGFDLMNDHLLDFYRNIMVLAGKGEEFGDPRSRGGYDPDSYLGKMNGLQADMIANNVIDPIRYLAVRASIEREVKAIANDVLTSGIVNRGKNRQEVRNLMKNPVFILNGGSAESGLFKGYSLENKRYYNVKRVREAVRTANEMQEISGKYRPKSLRDETILDQFKKNCRGEK